MKEPSDFHVGYVETLTHTVTQEDIERFVTLTGDDNKLHVNPEFASNTSFKTPVAHGMLGASFISTVIGTRLPGDGALWHSQTLEFLHPVRVGDVLTVRAEVVKKNDRMRKLELKTEVFNQNNQAVITGMAGVTMISPAKKARQPKQAQEKIGLVLGASGGIGRATARLLAEQGYDILAHYRSGKQALDATKKAVESLGQRFRAVPGDLTAPEDLAEIAKECERFSEHLTTLVNCTTPPLVHIDFNALSWEIIQEHLDVNLRGTYLAVKALLPLLSRADNAGIVLLGTQAVETPNKGWLHYITAKSGLCGFGKALALELAPMNIRVNLVSPGMTDTALIRDIPEKIRLITEAKTPLQRLASPEDVAGAIAYLASPAASFLTGETLRVNGGQAML